MPSSANLLYPFRRLTQAFRALPNAIIIGAQKAGTTYLFDLLAEHPEISVPFRKEVHFFDLRYGRGLGWYRAWFPRKSLAQRVVLEASPFYMVHPRCPERIKAHLPNARLIAILRDPVSRAYSGYQHQCRRGNEKLSFAEALLAEKERTASDRQHVDDVRHRLKALRVYSYRERGVYHEQLSRYLACFPRESLLVISSEQVFADPKTAYARVCRHLGVSEREPPVIPPSNTGGKYEKIDPAVAAELRAYYAPHNQRLYELIGEDFGW
jgi:hypothetical protein